MFTKAENICEKSSIVLRFFQIFLMSKVLSKQNDQEILG